MDPFELAVKLNAILQLFTLLFTGAGGLRNVALDVPVAVLAGSSVTLVCRYDLEEDPLYTVKWYKGREEIFRFVPKEHPPTRVFALPGIVVDISRSGPDRVSLSDVRTDLSGKYRCEVTTDAPDFHTQVVSTNLQIVEVPQQAPTLLAEKNSYALGDILRANCTTSQPLSITWLIDGHVVNESSVEEVVLDDDANSTAVSSALRSEVAHFTAGKLRLQCLATLHDVYSLVTELWLDEDRPRLASVLGTREASADNDASRNHGVIWLLWAHSCLLLFS